jgi:hypothetical protein
MAGFYCSAYLSRTPAKISSGLISADSLKIFIINFNRIAARFFTWKSRKPTLRLKLKSEEQSDNPQDST